MNFKNLTLSAFIVCISGCNSIPIPVLTQTPVPESVQKSNAEQYDEKSQSRVRLVSAYSSFNKYDNTNCEQWKKNKLKNYFHNIATGFPKTSNISLNMPPTEKSLWTLDTQKKSGIPNIIYEEYIVEANQPIVLHARYLEPASGKSCQVTGSFIPKKGQDYEVVYSMDRGSCGMQLKKITKNKVNALFQTENLNELDACR